MKQVAANTGAARFLHSFLSIPLLCLGAHLLQNKLSLGLQDALATSQESSQESSCIFEQSLRIIRLRGKAAPHMHQLAAAVAQLHSVPLTEQKLATYVRGFAPRLTGQQVSRSALQQGQQPNAWKVYVKTHEVS